MSWFVSRQHQWPEGTLCVEINGGGTDYANPGMLVEKYTGEGEEYDDPREAVEAAIKVAQAWQADEKEEPVGIAHGHTGGMTMPFEGEELTDETFAALREWANGEWEKLDKCCECGAVIRGRNWVYLYGDKDFKFCDSQCAENYECRSARELAEDEEEIDEEAEVE